MYFYVVLLSLDLWFFFCGFACGFVLLAWKGMEFVWFTVLFASSISLFCSENVLFCCAFMDSGIYVRSCSLGGGGM